MGVRVRLGLAVRCSSLPTAQFADTTSIQHNTHPPAAAQVLSVVLLSGKMHYCRDNASPKAAGHKELLDPYYLVPHGQSINKTWCACGVWGARVQRE